MNFAADFDPFAGSALERVVPTTEAQREVWLASSLGREASLAYNEAITLRLRGPLDAAALAGAIDGLVARHESLRSTVSADGLSLLVAAPAPVPLAEHHLRLETAEAEQSAIGALLDEAVQTPFDLVTGPLFRATLIRVSGDDHLLLLSAHHIVCDGWSFGVIARDLARLYRPAVASRATDASDPPPADAFAGYSAREVARAGRPEGLDDERFWLQRFEGAIPVLDLPTDRPRPGVRGFASGREDRLLAADLVTQAKRAAGRQGLSLFGLLAGTFAATLARIAGQGEVVLGVPAAGQSAAAMPQLVGHCVNLLPVRIGIDPAVPAADVLATAQGALLDAFEHQEYTFGTLLRQLPASRDPGHLPLVSVMFNLDQALDGAGLAFDRLQVDVASVPRRFENFELFVNATQVAGGLRLECQYNSGLFDAATVRDWLGTFEAMLRGVLADPSTPVGSLPGLDASQQARLTAWNDTARAVDTDPSVVVLVARQAEATPDEPAVVAGRARLTYRELRTRAHRIAQALVERGVKPGDCVGLCLERGVDMVAALLGVLYAGAAYVPLDPGFPSERLAFMAQDAHLALLVTETSVAHRLPWPEAHTLRIDTESGWIASLPDAAPAAVYHSGGESPAYVIYTSGSTGQPKGVVVPHRSVVNFLRSMQTSPGLVAGDRLVAVTTLSFDISVLELLLPLTVGACVVIASKDEVMDGAALRELLAASGATAMQATPAGWRLLLDAGWTGGPRFKALVGGEALPAPLASRLLDCCGELWNLYGPTETTVWSTRWRVQHPDQGVFIGTPIDNTQVHVLDARGVPCPIGVRGELCIGGAGVALGYHERPSLTAERFVPDPFYNVPGARLYRTGDAARWRSCGQLEHLGRLDTQVKIRGFRIELGEIESALGSHPDVREALAVVREDRPGDARLVAYWATSSDRPASGLPTGDALAAHLKRSLPEYMVPQHFVLLPTIPRLPNGKVDRGALPRASASPDDLRPRALPDTEMQRFVAQAMGKALGLPDVGVADDFFAIGGHSLLAAQVISQLNRQLGVRLSLRAIFEAPTVQRLARTCEAEVARAGAPPAAIVRRAAGTAAPLSLMQERMMFLERLQPGRTVYNTPSAHRLRGRIDEGALQRAFQAMLQRHEILRTSIVADGEGAVQRVHAALQVALFPAEDLSVLPAASRETELLARIGSLVDVPFDLSVAPLFVARMYRLGPEEHVLFFMPHHIVWDGWSFDLFYEEMSEGYLAELEHRPARLTPLDVSYGDFSAWQRDWVHGAEFARQAEHWRARFAESSDVPRLALMTDRPRGAVMSGEGRTEWMRFDRTLTERLRDLGRDTDATLFMTLLSAYSILLAGLGAMGGQIIGIPVRGRSTAETEPLMGYFTNLLPLRIGLRPDETFRTLQDRVRRAMLESFTFPDVPLERLMQDMPDLQGTGPLYQALFSFQDARRRPLDWGNLRHERLEISQRGATEDLGLWLVERSSGLVGGITYHADLYLPETAARLHARFGRILERIVLLPDASVDELLELDDLERERLRGWIAAAGRATAAPDSAPAGGKGVDTGPAPRADLERSGGSAMPSTPTERQLADLWSRLLGVRDVAITDNFFDLGGHSLLVMQAVSTMEQGLRRRIEPRRYIFESLAQIAAAYDEAPELPDVKRGLLGRLFGGKRRG